MRSTRRRVGSTGMAWLIVIVLTAAAAVLTNAGWIASATAQVTRGDFMPLDIPDLAIGGRAQMVRTSDSRTRIDGHVVGLEPLRTYSAHVHNRSCNDGRGGGHYQNVVGGAAVPPNELWLSDDPNDPLALITANPSGNARGNGTAMWTARPEARSVVVHLWNNSAIRIACADLL